VAGDVPADERDTAMSASLPQHIETTSERSAAIKGRPWLRFRRDRSCCEGLHVFTDGSTLGSYAAVLVDPTGRVEESSRWRQPTRTRNVGAEWDGFLLGLELLPEKTRATIVVDLLWIHAQLIGVRRTIDDEIVKKLNEARRLIEEKQFELVLVHHDGHQKDASDFPRWNAHADALCAEAAKRKK
jgi:hypothetical protein